ncbi:MAG: hypothetical protein WA621_11530, partial [Candidatus Acidiferrum sp.]
MAVLPRRRDGAGKSYFVCDTMWGCGSATLLDYSSRRLMAAQGGASPAPTNIAQVCRRDSRIGGDSRRGPGAA